MPLSTLLQVWQTNPRIAQNIAAWETITARPAQYVPFAGDVHPALVGALHATGIDALYTHQAAAWEHVRAGRHPIVVTGTASGKTLCYNLPILDRMLRDPEARALYLFPTKALAQDQLATLQQLIAHLPSFPGGTVPSSPPSPGGEPSSLSPACGGGGSRQHPGAQRSGQRGRQASPPLTTPPSFSPLQAGGDRPSTPERRGAGRGWAIGMATYDGDTPSHARPAIRQQANLILSNPDMLHMSILPHHTAWASFFAHLAFVVVDEAHTYRGVFGSHVANVLRRLRRIAGFYGASPQFILTSATIGNPVDLGERLIEEPVTLIDDDGAPRGDKHFVIYNPPVIDPAIGLRRSMLFETVNLAAGLLEQDVQTIIFGRARQTVEIILSYLHALPSSTGGIGTVGDEDPIRAYRGGYLPTQRRAIERGLRDGSVRGVVATTALELGIDIGGMGAALLAGYPGTIAGTWQQAGRAGRQAETSLAAMIASPDPLDQFLAQHPDYFFGHSPEQALINPDNLLILLSHLRCAAFELPFHAGEPFGTVDGEQVAEFMQLLLASGVLHRSGDRYFWMSDQYPARDISLRSTSPDPIVLQTVEAGEPLIIGQVDHGSAHWMVHPDAVYLHQGQQYLVEDLDLAEHIAHLRPVALDYYTQPRSEKAVQLIERRAQAGTVGALKAHGEIRVTEQVIGYRKVKWFTHEQLGLGDLDLPPVELQTTGYWLSPTEETIAHLRERGLWSSDPNNYGPNWEAQRDAARARDEYRCQVCGVPEHDKQHDVHHRLPFRAFDSYREANRLDNLVTLCVRCHRRAEMAVRVRSGLSGLAFVLGHLAPLFLMCDARDVGVHADPRSPLAGGLPAVVVYDGVPAGIGFSERLYELHPDLMARACELVVACPCLDGCPSCVGPGGETGTGGKAETLALLEKLTSEP